MEQLIVGVLLLVPLLALLPTTCAWHALALAAWGAAAAARGLLAAAGRLLLGAGPAAGGAAAAAAGGDGMGRGSGWGGWGGGNPVVCLAWRLARPLDFPSECQYNVWNREQQLCRDARG